MGFQPIVRPIGRIDPRAIERPRALLLPQPAIFVVLTLILVDPNGH
jgi:hypothetical protein